MQNKTLKVLLNFCKSFFISHVARCQRCKSYTENMLFH